MSYLASIDHFHPCIAGAVDEHGLHLNGTEVDCTVCKTDLWLSAVVSRAVPAEAACPEHAASLPGSPADKVQFRDSSSVALWHRLNA